MSDPNIITAGEFPDGPSQGLSMSFRLHWSKTHPPADPTVSYAEKTVLVTGANTGLGNPTYESSPAGWTMAVQVNALSTALMALWLLPLLRSEAAAGPAPPHLIFVNSHGHSMVPKESPLVDGSLLKTANEKGNWNTGKSYSLGKWKD